MGTDPLAGVRLSSLSMDTLNSMYRRVQDELVSRAMETADPDTLIVKALSQGFTKMGDPIPPQDMGGGVVSITGMVKDTSARRHRCHLYTIRPHEESPEEWWAWDEESPTFIHSETSKVDTIRRTASLHAAVEGMLIIQHSMVWDGERHERKSVTVYQVSQELSQEGEVLRTNLNKMTSAAVRRLPPPPDRSGY